MSSWATLRLQPDNVTLEAELAVEAAMALTGVPMGSAPAPSDTRELLTRIEAQFRSGNIYRFGNVGEGSDWSPLTVVVEQREEDGIGLVVTYPRSEVGESVRVSAPYLSGMPSELRSAFSVVTDAGDVRSSAVLRPSKQTTELRLLLKSPLKPNANPSPKVDQRIQSNGSTLPPVMDRGFFLTYFGVGLEHILSGYDHLLFLVGLLVVCRRVKSVLLVITCFTVGHSVTLASAAVGWIVAPSRLIEPLIAASIIFVGVENLIRRDEPKKRWALALLFGLVHGFGFAGALRDMGFGSGGTSIVVPLFAFNLGVELGQLAVVAVLLPILLLIRTQPRLAMWDTKLISGGIATIGVIWLVARL
jgi:hydrogenase/urease accessory protein HupE